MTDAREEGLLSHKADDGLEGTRKWGARMIGEVANEEGYSRFARSPGADVPTKDDPSLLWHRDEGCGSVTESAIYATKHKICRCLSNGFGDGEGEGEL